MRARYPDRDGFVERDGVKLYYEIHGDEDARTTVLLLPTWSLWHSRHWKMQVPYLARHYRVVTFDGRGNGRSDRPSDDGAYGAHDFVADAVAVLDALGVDRCAVAGMSLGGHWALMLGALHPERVQAVISIAPASPMGVPAPEREGMIRWNERIPDPTGWEKHNRWYWLSDYEDWVNFFVGKVFSERHSTKQREDGVGWALETDGETLGRTHLSPQVTREEFADLLARLDVPTLIIHGTDDKITPYGIGEAIVEATGAEFLTIQDGGHAPIARDPVQVNLAIREFVDRATSAPRPARSHVRRLGRRPRALYVSSPIGLGHARRDVAIADELRALHPDLEIDWLAQDPVTRVLDAKGERIHPASRFSSSEVAHIDSESGEHSLHCFQAWRRMDEILLANFMLFHEVVRDGDYDLVIGDESWEIDYYLHENPSEKNTPYVWLTDFVGWLPMPSGGRTEAEIAADYNEEMIRHIARNPRTRDRAIFVGNPDDIVPEAFGPGLPLIREWTEEHYSFTGYVTGFDPDELGDRDELRAELGYAEDEKVCIVTVGGSGVGLPLLQRIAEAFPAAKDAVPELRMVLVAGPRIDPERLPAHEGLEVRSYVDRLYRHLAVTDLAVVQGGLTTCMELTASRRPFLYVPLADHFEQNFHVRARLDRYGAGRHLPYDQIEPDGLAEALIEELQRDVDYRPVETDGAARAASMIAELL